MEKTNEQDRLSEEWLKEFARKFFLEFFSFESNARISGLSHSLPFALSLYLLHHSGFYSMATNKQKNEFIIKRITKKKIQIKSKSNQSKCILFLLADWFQKTRRQIMECYQVCVCFGCVCLGV